MYISVITSKNYSTLASEAEGVKGFGCCFGFSADPTSRLRTANQGGVCRSNQNALRAGESSLPLLKKTDWKLTFQRELEEFEAEAKERLTTVLKSFGQPCCNPPIHAEILADDRRRFPNGSTRDALTNGFSFSFFVTERQIRKVMSLVDKDFDLSLAITEEHLPRFFEIVVQTALASINSNEG